MRKTISILLIVGILFSFSGCSTEGLNIDSFIDDIDIDEVIAILSNLGEGENYDCDHSEAYEYNEDDNTVTCECGSVSITGLSYSEFVDVLSPKQKKVAPDVNARIYYAELYFAYNGIQVNFLNLIQNLPKDVVEKEDTLNEIFVALSKCCSALGYIDPVAEAYKEHLEGKEELETAYYKLSENLNDKETLKVGMYEYPKAEQMIYADALSKSFSVLNSAVSVYNFLDTSEEDPEKACMDFVKLVGDIIGYAPDHYGAYYTIMIDALSFTLEKFFEEYKQYEFQQEVWDAAINNRDGCFTNTTGWNAFQWCSEWEKYLEGVEGTEGTDMLPSVEDAIAAYKDVSDAGKELLSKYIVFRLNKIFKEELGISYAEFVKLLQS